MSTGGRTLQTHVPEDPVAPPSGLHLQVELNRKFSVVFVLMLPADRIQMFWSLQNLVVVVGLVSCSLCLCTGYSRDRLVPVQPSVFPVLRSGGIPAVVSVYLLLDSPTAAEN